MEVRVRGRQESDKLRYDSSAKLREFNVGDPVFSRNYFGRYRWKAGVILRRTGPVSYYVQVGNGVDHRHASQLRGRQLSMDHPSEEEEIDRDIQSALDAAEEREQEPADHPPQPIPQQIPLQQQIPQAPAAIPRSPLRVHEVPKVVPQVPSGTTTPPRTQARQAVAAAAAPPPPPPMAAAPPAGRTLRPRENLHARQRFADEYSKPGSG